MSDRAGAVGVVLAAGMGTRVGADGNKAYLRLAGRSMVSWSVEAVARTPDIDRTVVVYRRGELDLIAGTLSTELPSTAIEFVEGGETRHGSEWNLLQYLADAVDSGSVDVVLIHDAARPLADSGLMSTALATARAHGGAIPGVPAYDAMRVTADGLTAAGPLVRVQTPQAFLARPLLHAYRAADAAGFEGTDTASCIERFADIAVHVFDGAAANFKVTFAPDVLVADRLLSGRVTDGW
ncbi:IspD/TarI family cytidylyltransferase [Mycolicibacterium arenosum]|uniref:2-C-methyl-D-erythritol 4-phosphate cytidylyltransferase n=1 Tax=Mycolicibacterium arenosum TaxID=2952157 RepID=A0ABT1M6C3_9MYCO|nr:IspD/TarI family cytidylyltransferase [Mycolicibacterium sp. CAU 1645]MCP9273357.1 2-C-methyl-D-erythritol 4-phosphate cytidylyltransferase [Mycolicibacterium sp. CAU 1645]